MFRFSIRELLLLTLVVALGAAFYMQRVDSAHWRGLVEITQSRASLTSHRLQWVDNELGLKGYDLRYDDESGTLGFYYIEPPLPQATRAPHPSDAH